MKTTTHTTKYTQDYTDLGYGLINTYHKQYVTDGRNTGKIIYYTCTVNGVESKRYNRRGNACNAMYKAAAKVTN